MAVEGFEGVGEMVKRIREAADGIREGTAEGLLIAAEFVLGESNERVPFEEGDLTHSGSTSVDRDNLRAAISYDTEYAVRQHEDLSYHHDAGRQAKYLESAIADNAKEIGELIRAGASSRLRGM